MIKEELDKALLTLAFEITASMSFANICAKVIKLENADELKEVSDYIKKLVENSK